MCTLMIYKLGCGSQILQLADMGSYKQMVAVSLFTFTLFVSFTCCSLLSCNAPHASIRDSSQFGKLVLSQLLLSPGRTNIQRTFPNDIHGSRCNWIEGYGELTLFGKRDQYELGEWLRKRYVNLLLDYHPDNVYVCSVDSDKALTSVLSTMAALFDPTKDNFTDGWNWQPIPIHTVQKDRDAIMQAKPCPKYETALELYLNSPPVMEINNENKDLYKKLTNETGMRIANIQDVAELYETLEIENWRNLTLPEWAANLFPGELLKFSVYSHLIPTSTEELKLFRAGPLLKEVADHLKKKMNETILTSLFMYSAEEDTVAAILNSLRVFNCLPPPSSAVVLIELWTSGKELSVTVSYKNETTREPYVLSLPGCQPLCPLDDFLLVLENSIPQNWTKECSALSTGLNMETIALRVVCAILAIIMIAMIVIVILCLRRRNSL